MTLSMRIVIDILKGKNDYEESYGFVIQALYDNGYFNRCEYDKYLHEKVSRAFLLDILETSRPTIEIRGGKHGYKAFRTR